MSHPLAAMSGPVRALLSDIDGTLTTAGRLEPETYSALASLVEAGIPVILVTGRPAGWGQALLSLAPVAAVVTENGGLTFVRRGHAEERHYALPRTELADWRERMHRAVAEVERAVPGARLSSDSAYREVDLAIDWNEEASLSLDDANRVVEFLRAAGFRASRSSVHVNFGPPRFDKYTACLTVLDQLFGDLAPHGARQGPESPAPGLAPYVYVGDALNDAPMFAGFPRSVGVANVRAWWDELPDKPRYLTASDEGRGLREVIERVRALGPAPRR